MNGFVSVSNEDLQNVEGGGWVTVVAKAIRDGIIFEVAKTVWVNAKNKVKELATRPTENYGCKNPYSGVSCK